jgi:hypothetical protein
MQRVNIFYLIHKGLRASLFRTAALLQQTDFDASAELEEAIESVREVMMLFEEHAAKEDKFILSAVALYEPSVADAFAQEHEEDHRLAEQLGVLVARLEAADSAPERIELDQQLNSAFVQFVGFNLHHMAKEEQLLNEMLWRFYSDADILAIQKEIIKSTEPWISSFFTQWLLRGINGRETVSWLEGVRATAPDLVYQTLYQQAQRELPKQKFQQVAKALESELQLA